LGFHPFLQTTVEDECAEGKLVVVNFFAPECYACKSMQPKLRQIARDNPDALFLKVNGLVSCFMVEWLLCLVGSAA
jgi:thiol-disulfide isomerase/thioredoxin